MNLRETVVRILKNPSGELWIQVFRYLISGGVAFLTDAALLALLTELFGRDLLLLWTGISFAVGLLITYLFSILWVFDNRSLDSRTAELTIFVMIGVIGLCLTEFLMHLLAERAGVHYLLAKCITTVIVFVWNFVAKKTILFKSASK